MIRHVLIALLLSACSREPASEPPPDTATTAPSVTASAAPPASAKPSASVVDAGISEPPLLDAQGKPLPQLEDEPSTDSPLFRHHLELLVRAIAANDPEIARSVFFPVQAYEQVKAIENPARDWEHRLWSLFKRDVGTYHRELGERIQFLRFDAQPQRKQWMKPGSEGNLLGYWRMTRNQLVVSDADGKERKLEVTSLISWRGEWYVVHLHGFK
ncbi:MAG TPA: hypothetical protein VFB62_00065 [Polyangiaceae bacterium]|nr:hypothetical protein [Polyangiaceae bacterium]